MTLRSRAVALLLACGACGGDDTSTVDGGGLMDATTERDLIADAFLDMPTVPDGAVDAVADASSSYIPWSLAFGKFNSPPFQILVAPAASNKIAVAAGVGDFGAIDFGGGSVKSTTTPIVLVKLDSVGGYVAQHEVRSAADGGYDRATLTGLALDATGQVLITGSAWGTLDFGGGPIVMPTGSAFIATYDVSLALQTVRVFGGWVEGAGIAVDSAGNVYFAAARSNNVDFGGGVLQGYGLAIVKFDKNGVWKWNRMLAGNTDFGGFALDAKGNLAVAGVMGGALDLGPLVLPYAGGQDGFFARFDAATGATITGKSFGGGSLDRARAIAYDSSTDEFVIGGQFQKLADFGNAPLTAFNESDGFLVRYDLSSPPITRWVKQLGVNVSAVASTSAGVVVFGQYYGLVNYGCSTASGSGLFRARFDATGKCLVGGSYPTSGANAGSTVHSVAIDQNNHPIVSGNFFATLDFGYGPLISNSAYRYYIATFAQ